MLKREKYLNNRKKNDLRPDDEKRAIMENISLPSQIYVHQLHSYRLLN